MEPTKLTVSFVSGKGGVGKTSLASNFAWICSRLSKTVLVDLDFQNQGCTGLLLHSVSREGCGAFEILSGTSDFASCKPTLVEENLYFVPAVSIACPPQYSLMPKILGNPKLSAKLSEYITFLRAEFSFDSVILDCHGGLDYASVAAFEMSSQTIVVTEADPVTFNGTLELLSFYDSEQQSDERVRGDLQPTSCEAGAKSSASTPQMANERKRIHFLVNRLPPKYRFLDIRATYRRLLEHYSGRLNLAREVLSFIPEETFIAESFGEYPFIVKLAPTSIIARKLQLVAIQLLRPEYSALGKYRPFRKLRSPRFRKKVERSVISAEGRNTRNIIQAFGLSVSVLFLFMVAYCVFFAWFEIVGTLADFTDSSIRAYDAVVDNKPFLVIAVLSTLCFVFYAVKAQFGLMFYYRDAYRFRRALLRATGDHLNLWQRLMLLRLWILRAGNSVVPMFLGVLAGISAVALLVVLVEAVFLKR